MLNLWVKCPWLKLQLAPSPAVVGIVEQMSAFLWTSAGHSQHRHSRLHYCVLNRKQWAIVKRHHTFLLLPVLKKNPVSLDIFQLNRQISSERSYEVICEKTLDSLAEFFEELLAEKFTDSQADVSLSSGVLTVHLGASRGTYVINKQTPNKQIWLSSPVSGPKRYDFIDGRWIYRRDGTSMHQLLSQEISEVLRTEVDFCDCQYGK